MSPTQKRRNTGPRSAGISAAAGVAGKTADVATLLVDGARLYRSGNLPEALAVVMRGLALAPDHPDLLNHRGVIAARLGDAAIAESSYRRALAVAPDRAEIHFNLGNLLRGQQRHVEAEAAYLQALALNPGYVEVRSNLGNLLLAQGRTDEAETAFRAAITLRPSHADAWSNLGNLLHARARPQEAEDAYRRAIELNPEMAEAHSNLGVLLKSQKRIDQAEAAYRHAMRIRPTYVEAYSNLGVLLLEQQRFEEAEVVLREAIALRPGYADALCNLGNLLQAMKRPLEAEDAYRQALASQPGNADARWNLSLLLLTGGRLAEGWREHEARHEPSRRQRKAFPPPTAPGGPPLPAQWQGENLSGRALLVWPEQGLGDEIQFVRYLPLLRQRGPRRLVLACKPPLKALFARQGFADQVIGVDEWHPDMAAEFDYWTYLLSLPLRFETTLENIPATIPYLEPHPDRVGRWQASLPSARLRVGLAWKGNPAHRNDAHRSLPSLETLKPLWSLPGIAWVSLQQNGAEEIARARSVGHSLLNLGSQIKDFADSAAIVSQLDLVICVDTALAHLAGALGVPCWVLLPDFGTDWRWLEGREDSPWYPRVMRLFRQAGDGAWEPAVARVHEALGDWTATTRLPPRWAPQPVCEPAQNPLPAGWYPFGKSAGMQSTFEVSVVMPTLGRESLLEAILSVYAQRNVSRIQLLVGVDQPQGDFQRVFELLGAAPEHVVPCLFYPGYSTSRRHGGLHPAGDGGVLRTVLSYLANARYLAYLDDDNWWAPEHLRSLLDAVGDRRWAFARRWFVHPQSRRPICIDDWESLGPGRGVFLDKFGGWVDPNCLLLDKLACEPVLRWWSIPMKGRAEGLAADRHVYDWLQRHGPPGESGVASVFYVMQPRDVLHRRRVEHMGQRYEAAGQVDVRAARPAGPFCD